MGKYHIPVMLAEVLDAFYPVRDSVIVDGTLGGGGHSEGMLEKYPRCRIVGIDADADALEYAGKRLSVYGDRAKIFRGNFRDIPEILSRAEEEKVGGILLDLGVSSHQLEKGERGFSFLNKGELDMRMDTRMGESAYNLVNERSKSELQRIIKMYGEEKWASRIARNIVAKRAENPIRTTSRLSQIVSDSIPGKFQSRRIHPATRTFLALRIAVNSELENLKSVLRGALSVLKEGGRICVISYHSLEDRIVKQFFVENEKGCVCPPEIVQCVCNRKVLIKRIVKKPLRASKEEVDLNPRARSALLRIAERAG